MRTSSGARARWIVRGALAALCTVPAPAYAQAPSLAATPAPPPARVRIARHFMAGRWRAVGTIGEESGLGRPALARADGNTIYVFDQSDLALKAFGLDGALRWSFGHGAKGVGGFRQVSGIAVDAKHRVWVADPDDGRMVIVDESGKLVRTIDGIGAVAQVAPEADGSFWAMLDTRPVPLHFDPAGRHPRPLALPPSLAHLHPLQAVGSLAGAPDGAMAITYLWSGRFVVARASGAGAHVYDGVEEIVTPPVVADTLVRMGKKVPVRHLRGGYHTGASSASIDHGILYESFANHGPDASALARTVDTYDVATGRYLGSYLVPVPVTEVQVHDGVFVALTAGAPRSIRIWRWIPSHP